MPLGSVVRQVTASRWATIEWTTFPEQTHNASSLSCITLQPSPPTAQTPVRTRLVVQEANGAVLVCGDGDRLSRVADHTVDQLAACGEPREKSPISLSGWLGGGGTDGERDLPSLVCVSSAAALCSVVRSYSTVSPPSKDTTT